MSKLDKLNLTQDVSHTGHTWSDEWTTVEAQLAVTAAVTLTVAGSRTSTPFLYVISHSTIEAAHVCAVVYMGV